MNWRLFLLWILLIGGSWQAEAQAQAAPPAVIQAGQETYLLGLHLDILEDPHQEWTIDQVSSAEFATKFYPSSSLSPNFGFSHSAYWLRVSLFNALPHPLSWYLEVAYPLLDYVTLYSPHPEGFHSKLLGDQVPFAHREIRHNTFFFAVDLKAQSQTTYYLRVQSSSTLSLPLKLWSPKAMTEEIAEEHAVQGLYYGAMLVMIFYNLFLGLLTRERSYLYYSIFILSYVMVQLGLNGWSSEYIWKDAFWLNNQNIPFFTVLTGIWTLIFSCSFLQTKQTTPFLHKILTVLLIAEIVWLIPAFALPYAWNFKVCYALTLMIPFFVMAAGIRAWRLGLRPALYFVIAWFALLLGAALRILKGFGVLPDTFITNWGLQIGSVMEVVLLSFALADRINLIKKEREQALHLRLMESQKVAILSETFRKYVPTQFLDMLKKESILDVTLGDHAQKNMTIMFSDIRSFTTLSEAIGPEATFKFLNAYLRRMEPLIIQHGGFIDKYVGDSIMALFDQGPDGALKAAIAMLKTLREYNEGRQRAGYVPIRIGIGINTGQLMLGTIGGENRMDTTVISDAVNLASRVEELTKVYQAGLLITGPTFYNLNDPKEYAVRLMDRVRVKGKSQAVTVFEVFDGDSPEVKAYKFATRTLFEEGISLYYLRDFQEAYQQFQKCLEHYPQDFAAEFYLKRCEQMLSHGIPSDWEGFSVTNNS